MSLQGAYAAFLGMEGDGEGALTFEKYSVYSGLKRSGYTVHRAPSWNGSGIEPGDECYPPVQGTSWSLGLLRDKWRSMFIPGAATKTEQKVGPLVKPGLYRNYGMCSLTHCSCLPVNFVQLKSIAVLQSFAAMIRQPEQRVSRMRQILHLESPTTSGNLAQRRTRRAIPARPTSASQSSMLERHLSRRLSN